MNSKYYLYRHIRLDTNQPFYIGIGTKYNNNYKSYIEEYKRAFNKINRSEYWKRIANRTDYDVEILYESDNYEFIKEKEKSFIKLYGRSNLGLGTLCNMTDGGDGTLGTIYTEERRTKLSKSHTGKKRTIEQIKRLSDISKEANKKPIVSYTFCGEYVKEWDSIKEAASELNIGKTNISACAKNKTLYCNNLFWVFKSNDATQKLQIEYKIEKLKQWLKDSNKSKVSVTSQAKSIKVMNITNNEEFTFDSIKECSTKLNICNRYICRILKRNIIYKNKYKFSYI